MTSQCPELSEVRDGAAWSSMEIRTWLEEKLCREVVVTWYGSAVCRCCRDTAGLNTSAVAAAVVCRDMGPVKGGGK